MITMTFGVVAFADDVNGVTSNKYGPSQEVVDGILPETGSMEDASAWGERKMYEIVELLQRWVQPFAIIIFIICSFLILFGAIGNGRLLGIGMTGIALTLLVYAGVLFAPEILNFFSSWVAS